METLDFVVVGAGKTYIPFFLTYSLLAMSITHVHKDLNLTFQQVGPDWLRQRHAISCIQRNRLLSSTQLLLWAALGQNIAYILASTPIIG
jgi:hypothetical protein